MKAHDKEKPTIEDLLSENMALRAQIASGQEFFASVLDCQQDMIVRWRPNGERLYANSAYCKTFHISQDIVAGTKFESVIHPSDVAVWLDKINTLSPNNPFYRATHRVVLPTGKVAYQEWTDTAIFEKDGTVKEYQSVGRDVTGQVEHNMLISHAASLSSSPYDNRLFDEIASTLRKSLGASLVFVGSLSDDKEYIHLLGQENTLLEACQCTYKLSETPCENVVLNAKECVFKAGVAHEYPKDKFLLRNGIDAYCGVPLIASDGNVVGILVAIFSDPLKDPEKALSCLKIYSARATSEIELRILSGLWGGVFSNSPLQMARLDLFGKILEVNTSARTAKDPKMAGLVGGFLSDHPYAKQFPENLIHINRSIRLANKGIPSHFVAHATIDRPKKRSLTGRVGHFEVFFQPIRDAAGKISQIIFSYYDNTEQIRLHKAKVRTQRLEKELADVSAQLINSSSLDHMALARKVVAALRSYYDISAASYIRFDAKMVGHVDIFDHDSPDVIIKRTGLKIQSREMSHLVERINSNDYEIHCLSIDDYKADTVMRSLFQSEKSRSILEVPIVVDNKLKALIVLNSRVDGFFDDFEEIDSLQIATRILAGAIAQDGLRKNLEASQRHYRNLVEHVPGIVYRRETGVDGRFLYMSNDVTNILGTSTEDLLSGNVKLADLCIDGEAQRIQEAMDVASNNGRQFEIQFRVTRPDGTMAWIIDRGRILKEGRKNIIYGTMFDISNQKQAEEALAKLDETKNQFITTAAHELRTPLTSVLGYTEALLHAKDFGGWTKDQEDMFLEEIHSRGLALSNLIDTLLDVSRIRAGKMIVLNKDRYKKICQVVLDTLRQANIQFPDNKLRLVGDCTNTDCPAMVDADRFRQAIDNILSNAVKYSPKGSTITITTACTSKACHLIVSDEGRGVPENQLEKIFERFYRVNDSLTTVSGLGVGLSLVRDIVEAHNGTVWAENNPDIGTSFHIDIPSDKSN